METDNTTNSKQPNTKKTMQTVVTFHLNVVFFSSGHWRQPYADTTETELDSVSNWSVSWRDTVFVCVTNVCSTYKT